LISWKDLFPRENIYLESEYGILYCEDALKVLRKIPDNSIDSVVTDPPYGLKFMNKKWDYDVPSVELWKEVIRVLKPGGHLVSFFGTRTYHRGVVNIEDAGFEIRDMIVWLYGCVSEDTEILTTEGWKKYNEIRKGDKVFTFNLRTGKIELDEVKDVYIYRHNGKMINIVNDNTDQLLTLNHKVICDIAERERVSDGVSANHRRYVFTGTWKWIFANYLLNIASRVKLPLAGIYDGDISIGVELAELIGWIIAEGSIKWSKGEKSIRIYQTSSNPEQVKAIRDLLNKLGIHYKEYTRERSYKGRKYTEYQWFISYRKNKWLFNKILDFFSGKNSKKPSWKLLRLKYEERLALINALMNGDGSWSNRHFYQYDEETLVWFQALCHITGIQARINPKKHCCALHFNPTTEIQLLGKRREKYIKVVDYCGIVWSIRTNNMSYIARRNGRVFITGNSGFPKGQAIDKLIDRELGKYEERELIGWKKAGLGRNRLLNDDNWKGIGRTEAPVTEPATPEAKKWHGWGTALKPACEPIVLARKPISEKNIAQNVLKWGTGGLNIDVCRIPISGEKVILHSKPSGAFHPGAMAKSFRDYHENTLGRFPANVILECICDEVIKKPTKIVRRKRKGGIWRTGGKETDMRIYEGGTVFHTNPECPCYMLDEQSGILKSGKMKQYIKGGKFAVYGKMYPRFAETYGDSGGASRFFYCAKADRDERFAYCYDCDKVLSYKEWEKHKGHNVEFHPTVKPLKLIKYLVKLVTPPNGICLDPFIGTGTTAIACIELGFNFIGIEISREYCRIAEKRITPYLRIKRLDKFIGYAYITKEFALKWLEKELEEEFIINWLEEAEEFKEFTVKWLKC
jgi:site-specific DNA-methyltransferase (adenine-specific)